MKLKREFVTHNTGEEQIMVGTGGATFAGLVRSNRTAAFLVECLKTETTPEQITAKMAERYDAPREQIEKDVARVLDILRGIHALDE